jgi:hypothetical protein
MELPKDFAEILERVVAPGHQAAVAEVIQAATRLDDEGLRTFLDQFAARVGSSRAPVRSEELLQFLRASTKRGPASDP